MKEKEEVGGGCTVLPDLILQDRRKVLKSRVKGKGFVHVPAKIWGVGGDQGPPLPPKFLRL